MFSLELDAAWIDLYGVPAGRVFWEGDPSPGGSATLHVTGEEGDIALLFGAPAVSPVPIPVAPYGDVLIDPFTAFPIDSGVVSGEGSFAVAVPSVPQLSGVSLFLQGAVVTDPVTLDGSFTNVSEFAIP